MKKAINFVLLNFYGLLIGILLLVQLGCFFSWVGSQDSWWPFLVHGCVFFPGLAGAVHIFEEYPHRKRIYHVLLRKNLNHFHAGSFEEFMQVPCHRMVCLAVLVKLRRRNCYWRLFRQLYLCDSREFVWHCTIFIQPEKTRDAIKIKKVCDE